MNTRMIAKLFLVFSVLLVCSGQAVFADSLIESLPKYSPADLGDTTLNSVGSDSMESLLSVWGRRYQNLQPRVNIQLLSRGSATAPAALMEGTADIGPMARPMKAPELEEFKTRYGFIPTQIRTAIAAVGVYVSKENPRSSITVSELESIFSEARSETGALTWDSLGGSGAFAEQAVMAMGLSKDSELHGYFRQQVLKQLPFHSTVSYTADQNSLIKTVAANPGAIAFGNTTVNSPMVKTLAVSKGESKAFLPTGKLLASGDYPLSRYLNIYVVRGPGEELDETTKDFLRFILSQEGQQLVVENGLVPLPKSVVLEELSKLK